MWLRGLRHLASISLSRVPRGPLLVFVSLRSFSFSATLSCCACPCETMQQSSQRPWNHLAQQLAHASVHQSFLTCLASVGSVAASWRLDSFQALSLSSTCLSACSSKTQAAGRSQVMGAASSWIFLFSCPAALPLGHSESVSQAAISWQRRRLGSKSKPPWRECASLSSHLPSQGYKAVVSVVLTAWSAGRAGRGATVEVLLTLPGRSGPRLRHRNVHSLARMPHGCKQPSQSRSLHSLCRWSSSLAWRGRWSLAFRLKRPSLAAAAHTSHARQRGWGRKQPPHHDRGD